MSKTAPEQKTRAKRLERIAELRSQCQRLSDERAELEEINEREDAAPWIGACFKYRNQSSDGTCWWLYIRIVAHEHGNSFRALQCQSQSGGWHIVNTNDHIYLLPDPKARGFIRITRRQFDTAWNLFTKRIGELNTLL